MIGVSDLSNKYFEAVSKNLRLGIDVKYLLDDKQIPFPDMIVSNRIFELEVILVSDTILTR